MVIADMVWPSLYLINRIGTWWAILIGLVVEFLFLWKYFKYSALRAIFIDVIMNLFSALLGFILIPASGIIWEMTIGQLVNVILNAGTFNPITWIASVLLAIVVNGLVEGLVLKLIFKYPIQKKQFLILFIANSLSVLIAFGSLFIFPLNIS